MPKETSGRGRSVTKRASILDAARTLFVADGYESVSVDAIAARAGVSKRTVYDHFGDKERLYLAVLDEVRGRLMTVLRSATADELSLEHLGRQPAGRRDAAVDRAFADALHAFVRRVATETFWSSDFAVFRRLTTADGAPRLPAAVRGEQEALLVERMTAFAEAGLISSTDPRRATTHFVALTFLVALEALAATSGTGTGSVGPRHPDLDGLLVDGVDVFLRAYR